MEETVDFPVLSLVFEKVEAEDPVHLRLYYSLCTDIPASISGLIKNPIAALESWHAEVNGKKASSGFSLEYPNNGEFPLNPAIPLILNMDIDLLVKEKLAPADDYSVRLVLNLNISAAGGNTGGTVPDSVFPYLAEVECIAVFPGVRPPVFSITSIAILKAELINTRFRVGLKIDNPNPYPVELSAFGYELYGNGRLWADGIEKNVMQVKAKSSLTGNLFLIMNFINMKRDLLDQVINLVDVNYRFSGEANVGTGVEYLPVFKTGFDLSGYSQVLDN